MDALLDEESDDDPLDVLDEPIDLDSTDSLVDLAADDDDDGEMPDLGDLDDLLEADDDSLGIDDLADVADLMEETGQVDDDEEVKPDVKQADEIHEKKYISSSPNSMTYKAKGKAWMEVNYNEESSDSSLQKIDRPDPSDVRSVDDVSSDGGPKKQDDSQPEASSKSDSDGETGRSEKEIDISKAPEVATEDHDTLRLEKQETQDQASPELKSAEPLETIQLPEEKPKSDTPSPNLSSETVYEVDLIPKPPVGNTSNAEIIQLKNLHSSEKLRLEQEVRRLKNENEVLQQRLTAAERSLNGQEQSRADLVKKISKLTREKKAYEEQVRFWKNKTKQVEKEIRDTAEEKTSKLRETLAMSNKKLKLLKSGHKRKTTEMEIEMRRMEEKQTALTEQHELPSEITELQTLTLNQKIEMRMKDAEMKVLQQRLVEYKKNVMFKEAAEILQEQMKDMRHEVVMAHESKTQIIRTLTAEIQELQAIVNAYMTRSSTEDIRTGLIKGYHFARAKALVVHEKLFTSPGQTGNHSDADRTPQSQSWG